MAAHDGRTLCLMVDELIGKQETIVSRRRTGPGPLGCWGRIVLSDGEQFLRELSVDETLIKVPVVVVSTDSTDLRKKRMLDLGAKGYVRTPFAPETLRYELELARGRMHA